MTEQDWLTSDDPYRMFQWLRATEAIDRTRLGALFAAFCALIPPEAESEPPLGTGDWPVENEGGIALTDAVRHLAAATFEAMWSAGRDPNRRATLASVIRDIFGNLFRPVAFDPAWRTATAVAVARQMYETRDFGGMPILADALQDAGCEDEYILHHCRDTSVPHVRGCWVCDLVLDRL
jgi:hypothetical protein